MVSADPRPRLALYHLPYRMPKPTQNATPKPPGACPVPASRRLVACRTIEFAVLFGAIPGIIDLERFGRLLIPALMLGAVVVAIILWRDPTFDRKRFLNFKRAMRELPFMLTTFVIGALCMIGITAWLATLPQFDGRIGLFGLLKRDLPLYAVIMLAYPIFSVYPQELIFRTFFFHRYACLFRTPAMMIFASALSFGWAHVMFDNPRVPWDAELAVAFTFVGGLLFAWTYQRARSTAAAWLEHALFGDWVWTVGMGTLFYAGATTL